MKNINRPRTASQKAAEATTWAIEVPTPNNHQLAARLQREAAAAQTAAGKSEKAAQHLENATWHAGVAGSY